MFRRKTCILSVVSFFCCLLNGQSFVSPFHATRSPETLALLRIEVTAQSVTVYFSLENKVAGGYFCTDRQTYLYLPDKTRLRLSKASGIPYCPELHKFSGPGEKLHFELTFPPIPEGTKWIDIVEECGTGCYAVYGIVLDSDLNASLEKLFAEASRNTPEQNILLFRKFLEGNSNQGIEGLLYVNIINAALEAGNQTEAGVWYKRLGKSEVPRKELYINLLNNRGIKF